MQWDIRIAAAQNALARSRYSFLAITVVSVGLMVAAFNASWSWERFVIARAHESKSMREASIADQWEKNKTFTNAIFGISVSANDAPIISGISLSIMCVWFFFAVRRENHVIATIMQDAVKLTDLDLKAKIFFGVSSYLVFSTFSDNDLPIDSLEYKDGHPWMVARRAGRVLIYLPFISVVLIGLDAIVSLFKVSGDGPDALILLYKMKWYESAEALVQLAVSAGTAVLIFMICRRIESFDAATVHVLRLFRRRIAALPAAEA